MKNKKSRFWVFVFSFLPGAGEMYMGFMKMGLSLMLGFMLTVAVVSIICMDTLAVIPVTIYIYSFFHANNIRTMDDESFASLEDNYLFGFDGIDSIKNKLVGKYRQIVAAVLIFLGLFMMMDIGFNLLCEALGWDNEYLSTIYYFVRDEVPRFLIGIAIIWGGVVMLRGKKVEKPEVTGIEMNHDKSNEA